MKKKIIVGASIVLGALILGLLVWAAVSLVQIKNNSEKAPQEFATIAAKVDGVSFAMYELQHPGVPTNNSVIVMAGVFVDTSEKLAASIKGLEAAVYEAKIAPYYTDISLYIVDANDFRYDVLADRQTYFGSTYPIKTDRPKKEQGSNIRTYTAAKAAVDQLGDGYVLDDNADINAIVIKLPL